MRIDVTLRQQRRAKFPATEHGRGGYKQHQHDETRLVPQGPLEFQWIPPCAVHRVSPCRNRCNRNKEQANPQGSVEFSLKPRVLCVPVHRALGRHVTATVALRPIPLQWLLKLATRLWANNTPATILRFVHLPIGLLIRERETRGRLRMLPSRISRHSCREGSRGYFKPKCSERPVGRLRPISHGLRLRQGSCAAQ